jgi:hypothetical protein
MRYRAREAGFIGRRVKAGEVFDFDGVIPWADPVEQEAPPVIEPKAPPVRKSKAGPTPSEDDQI